VATGSRFCWLGCSCSPRTAVTAPPWDFGRLLGVYVAFFFIVAQLIAWLAFGRQPTISLLAGGTLIIAGGYIVSRG